MNCDNSMGPRVDLRSEAPSRFRIIANQADGSVALLTLCQTLTAARHKARQEVDRHLARLRENRLEVLLDRKRPSQVQVEQWIGTATSGQWKVVERSEGGYQFTFYDSPPRRHKHQKPYAGATQRNQNSDSTRGTPTDPLTPQCGDLVECVLLEKRTRKNGWFAKVVGYPVSGPITGSPPSSQALQPGMKIKLRICSFKLSTGAAQLAW